MLACRVTAVQVFKVSRTWCVCAQSAGISVSEGESVSMATNGLFWSPVCVWFQSCRLQFHRRWNVCVCVLESVCGTLVWQTHFWSDVWMTTCFQLLISYRTANYFISLNYLKLQCVSPAPPMAPNGIKTNVCFQTGFPIFQMPSQTQCHWCCFGMCSQKCDKLGKCWKDCIFHKLRCNRSSDR